MTGVRPGNDTDWSVERCDGIELIRCAMLTRVRGVRHAFTTRNGPDGEPFDLGGHSPAAADVVDVAERRRSLLSAVGLDGQTPVVLHQVHGATVRRLPRVAQGSEPAEGDGLITLETDPACGVATVRTADCVPILLADREGRAVAAVHAGWRGTASGIARRAVDGLGRLGIRPESLVAALGPAIDRCCYAVGRDVVRQVAEATGVAARRLAPDGRLDLRRANRLQLMTSGVAGDAVSTAPWCTACERDRFFSYRAEGGATGRLMACIGYARPAVA